MILSWERNGMEHVFVWLQKNEKDEKMLNFLNLDF